MPPKWLQWLLFVTRVGGSAIHVSEKLKCQQLPQIKIKSDSCEDVWIEFQSEFQSGLSLSFSLDCLDNQESLIVGAVYRPPNDNKNGFKMFEEAFVKVIKCFKANQKFVEERDLNINYDNINSSQTISNNANHINSVGCSQLVDRPVRISQISGTSNYY